MTTLRKLSAQAIRLLSSGARTKDSQLRSKYIQEEIRQIAQKLLRVEYFNTLNQGDRDVAFICIATYPGVAVQVATNGRNYVDLPSIPMNLKEGVGIQQVKPESSEPLADRAMIPIMPNELEMFRSLLVGLEVMKDQWCFEPDGKKIFFTERDEETLIESGIDTVEIKMCVIDPAQVDEDDTFPVPPEMEMDIIKEVLVLHGYQPAQVHDMINNSNPAK